MARRPNCAKRVLRRFWDGASAKVRETSSNTILGWCVAQIARNKLQQDFGMARRPECAKRVLTRFWDGVSPKVRETSYNTILGWRVAQIARNEF
jgi:hypothetical protein